MKYKNDTLKISNYHFCKFRCTLIFVSSFISIIKTFSLNRNSQEQHFGWKEMGIFSCQTENVKNGEHVSLARQILTCYKWIPTIIIIFISFQLKSESKHLLIASYHDADIDRNQISSYNRISI